MPFTPRFHGRRRPTASRLAGLLFPLLAIPAVGAGLLSEKTVFQNNFPKAVYFRIGQNGYQDYASWAPRYGNLDGMVTKAGIEELPGLDWQLLLQQMSRFARENPKQLVLLHYNGRDRLLVQTGGRTPPTFPGHWAYRESFALPNGPTAKTAKVKLSAPDRAILSSFLRAKSNTHTPGFNHPALLVSRLPDGSRNWARSEYVDILSMEKTGEVNLLRGQRGTPAKAFPTQGTELVLMESNFGRDYGVYNFSTACPRDDQGRSAADFFANEFAHLFGPDGPATDLDGVDMDVLYFALNPYFDVDNDGLPDGGTVDGQNLYAAGMITLMQKLREILGPNRLFLADGHLASNQRGVPWLNGMESEGIVSHKDSYREVAKTLNYFSYYRRHAASPQINFTFPKDNQIRTMVDEDRVARYGLSFTTGMGELTAHNILRVTRAEKGSLENARRPALIADELVAGTLHQLGWLGRPLHELQLIGLEKPELWGNPDRPQQRVESKQRPRTELPKLNLPQGGDLIVTFEARASGSAQLGPDIPTILEVSTEAARAPHNADPIRALVGPDVWQPVIAYFRELAPGQITVEVTGDGPGWIELRNFHAHNAQLGMVREFERGVTLTNLSARPLTFDLAKLKTPRALKRLSGSQDQNPHVNDGTPVQGPIELEGISGLFLINETAQ